MEQSVDREVIYLQVHKDPQVASGQVVPKSSVGRGNFSRGSPPNTALHGSHSVVSMSAVSCDHLTESSRGEGWGWGK